MSLKSEFNIKYVLNDFAPILVLLELEIGGDKKTAAEINNNIHSKFIHSLGEKKIKYQPSLIYNLMSDLRKSGLVVRDDDDVYYSVTDKGRQHLAENFIILKLFIKEFDSYVNEFNTSEAELEKDK
jgi:DNA-binding PadR family transcriptional regulator